jgi:hypothetical protein
VQLILLTDNILESGEMTMVHGIDLQFVVDFKESTLVWSDFHHLVLVLEEQEPEQGY